MSDLSVGQTFIVNHTFVSDSRSVNLGATDVSGFRVASPQTPVGVTINGTPYHVTGVNVNTGVILTADNVSQTDGFFGAAVVVTDLPSRRPTPTPAPSPSATPAPPSPTPSPSATPAPPAPTPSPTSTPAPTATPVPPTATPAPTATLAESDDQSTVFAGKGGQIVDAQGVVWTITSGGQIAKNGKVDPVTNGVTQLAYANHALWQINTAKDWYQWLGTKWGPSTKTSPLRTISVSAVPAQIV